MTDKTSELWEPEAGAAPGLSIRRCQRHCSFALLLLRRIHLLPATRPSPGKAPTEAAVKLQMTVLIN